MHFEPAAERSRTIFRASEGGQCCRWDIARNGVFSASNSGDELEAVDFRHPQVDKKDLRMDRGQEIQRLEW
jgi:hypothetical protein